MRAGIIPGMRNGAIMPVPGAAVATAASPNMLARELAGDAMLDGDEVTADDNFGFGGVFLSFLFASVLLCLEPWSDAIACSPMAWSWARWG